MAADPPVSGVLHALAHQVRYRILQYLTQGELCVSDLEQLLGLGQSKISYHLSILEEARLIKKEQRGKHTYCHLEWTVLYRFSATLLTDLTHPP